MVTAIVATPSKSFTDTDSVSGCTCESVPVSDAYIEMQGQYAAIHWETAAAKQEKALSAVPSAQAYIHSSLTMMGTQRELFHTSRMSHIHEISLSIL